MKNNALYFVLWLILILPACKKPGAEIDTPDPEPPAVSDTLYTSDHQKNLAIVYFVPSDNDTIVGWHKRLSEIFIYGQKMFGENMQRAGYGYKTYGLLKDSAKGLIKIILIKGKLTKDAYPYSGGADPVSQEIKEYMAAHPAEFTSDHVMVMMPVAEYAPDGNPGGVPFYGTGKWAYGLDYPYLDMKNRGSANADESRGYGWIGATLHEMAHALNVPHNREKQSDRTTPGLGYALMGPDMRKFNTDQAFLTDADCAILNTNQVFQKNSSITYYGTVNASIKRIAARYDSATAAVKVAGRFETDLPVTNIIYYLDPNVNNEGTGTNNDYNAVTWRSTVLGTDSFNIAMPVGELFTKGNTPYELKVKLVHENGRISQTIYPFNFLNDIPHIDIKNELDKTDWKVLAQSSQESNYPASNVIDGKLNTYWRSAYTSYQAVLPHAFRVDMAGTQTINGISFRQRSDVLKPVKDLEIMFSDQPNSGWVSAGKFTALSTNKAQYFDFGVPVAARYFRLVVTSNHDGTNDSGIGEVGMY